MKEITQSRLNESTKKSSAHAFFLSDPLTTQLKSFPRSYLLRTSYTITWTTADKYAFDDVLSNQVFTHLIVPKAEHVTNENADPIFKGYEKNLGLCAFYWVTNRFVNAVKYCLNCGVQVKVVGRRPYVCDNALCLYGMMSLGSVLIFKVVKQKVVKTRDSGKLINIDWVPLSHTRSEHTLLSSISSLASLMLQLAPAPGWRCL